MQKSTGQLHNSWHNFSKYRPLIRELVTRDLKVKYRRSVLGYMWSILNPLLMMLLQTLVFSYMFRFDIPNFPLYLICGNTLFNFFNESTNMGMGSVLGNASLIKKVYVPKFIFPISRVVSSFVNLLFSLAAILLVMLITRSPFYWTILLVWAPLLLLLAFCCGMAVLLSALAVYFRDLQYLYGILTMAWMYATPLFYPISALPPFMVPVIKLNPLYLDMRRKCLVVSGKAPDPEPKKPRKAKAAKPAAAQEKDEYQKILDELRRVNDEIPDEEMTDKISRLEAVSTKIFEQAKADPDKLPQMRKFMDYYLPTSLKLLNTYAELDKQGIEGENISESKHRIEQTMDTLVKAFENQLDRLFASDALDVSTDIDVMQNMLRADGLTDDAPFKL
uniref:5-bromo-4-chloroindolyl phosphate hydrolysis family protein n=1 Tax=Gemmiger formicilis TaxID=745368 RepID=UPI003FF0439E